MPARDGVLSREKADCYIRAELPTCYNVFVPWSSKIELNSTQHAYNMSA